MHGSSRKRQFDSESLERFEDTQADAFVVGDGGPEVGLAQPVDEFDNQGAFSQFVDPDHRSCFPDFGVYIVAEINV